MKIQSLHILLLTFFKITLVISMVCKPNVEFDKCKTTTGSSNPYWNSDKHSSLSFRLNIRKLCTNSVLRIEWTLQNMRTKQFYLKPQWDNEQEVILDTTNLKTLEPYIVTAIVKESAFGFGSGSVAASCWFRLVNRYNRLEKIAPRVSEATSNKLKIETNTRETGWINCADPKMFIMTSPESDFSGHIFFGEISELIRLMNSKIKQKSEILYAKTSSNKTNTKNEIEGIYTLRREFFEVKGRQIDIIRGLRHNKKYRFLLCKYIYLSKKCDTLTDIITCPNLAVMVKCSQNVGNKTIFDTYKDVIGINCSLRGKPLDESVAYGLYSVGGGASHGKGPKDILIGHFTDYKSINFRLFPNIEHVVMLRPIETKTHIRFNCLPQRCKDSTMSFTVTSSITNSLNISTTAQIYMLKRAKDGKLPCPLCNSKLALSDFSFKSLVSSGKLNDAVQLALSLLKDQEVLLMKDIEINEFQISMLTELAKITDWTWPRLELMVGLLPHFDLNGISKEVSHTKTKALLLKNMMKSMKKLILTEKFPMTLRLDMEEIYFDEFFRQISLLFDPDFIMPHTFREPYVQSPDFHSGIKEEYEDYSEKIDDCMIDDFIQLTHYALKALSYLLFSRSKTLHYKEEHLTLIESGVTSKIFNEFENIDYIETNISSHFNVKLGNPVAMPPTEKEFRFIWSLIDREGFFWHNDSYKCTSQYLYMQFYSGDTQIKKGFDINPIVQIRLAKQIFRVQADGIVVPCNLKLWKSSIMDRFMRVYRINVKKYVGYTFAIYITKITRVKRLRIIIDTNGKKPVLGDFSNPKTEIIIFDEQNTAKFLSVTSKGYWYIAVLPYEEDIKPARKGRSLQEEVTQKEEESDESEDIEENSSKRIETFGIQYLHSFMMYSCPMLIKGVFKHDVCTVLESSAAPYLECECSEVGGPLAPSVSSVSYKLYGIVDIPTKLELTVEFIVVIFTLISIFIYCLLLILWPYRSRPTELIYFLADNAKQSRFGYLVRVTTADFTQAGTTAHIGIQLYGSTNNSRRHILNYPDPDCRLLRTASTDHFLVATDESLGNLERLEIWSDCSGFKPEWYCESIRVYDIQRYISWHFNVQKRFSIRDGYYSHYFVKPTHPTDPTVRTPWKHFNFHVGGNHTWNILESSHDQYWSYMERLTIILTHVLGTFALALYIIHPPIFEFQDGIGISKFNNVMFFVKTIAIVTFIVAPVNYLLSCFLKGSYKSGRFRGRYGYFPRCYSYVSWIALFTINILCLVYCLVYGPFISSVVVYDWVVVVILSLLINIFFVENLLLALHALIHLTFFYLNAWVPSIGTTYLYKEIISDVENQRKFLYRYMDRRGIRPFITAMYKPLGGDILKKRRQEIRNKTEIKRTYTNMLNVWVTLIFLILLIPYYKDERSAIFNKHLHDMFVFGKSSPKGIYHVTTHDELYDYLNTTLITSITPTTWYWPYTVADSGIIKDLSNKIIGNVRIRQQRAKEVACLQPEIAKAFGLDACLSSLEEMTMKNSSHNEELKHNNSMWWHHSEDEPNTYNGFLLDYNGDGYMINIGKTRANALYRVRLLYDNQWLDDNTKFVIVEMLLYNANTNLFADVRLVWEREAKYMYPSRSIIIARLINVKEGSQKFNILILLAYAYISFRMLIFALQALFTRSCTVFKSFREIGVLIFCIINVYAIVLFITRNIAINKMLNGLKHADRTKFVPHSYLILLHREIEVVLAVAVCIIILLLIEFLEFTTWTSSISKAVRRACSLFITVFVYVTICLLFFGIVSHMFYGNTLNEFKNFSRSCIHFVLVIARCDKTDLWQKVCEESGNFVIIGPILLVGVIFVTKAGFFMGCAWYLSVCKKEASAMRYNYTLQKYLADKLDAFKTKWHVRWYFMTREERYVERRERGGESEPSIVTPAPDSYRYRNAVYLSEWRLKKQELITKAYLRNTYVRKSGSKPSSTDIEYMRGISELVVGPHHLRQDLYFEQRIPETPCTTTIVVPDEKMRTMARIAEKVLEYRGKTETDKKENVKDDEDEEKVKEEQPQTSKAQEKKPKDLTKDRIKEIGKIQSKQLQGMLVILEISNDVIDTLTQKLLGPFAYGLPKVECCEDED